MAFLPYKANLIDHDPLMHTQGTAKPATTDTMAGKCSIVLLCPSQVLWETRAKKEGNCRMDRDQLMHGNSSKRSSRKRQGSMG